MPARLGLGIFLLLACILAPAFAFSASREGSSASASSDKLAALLATMPSGSIKNIPGSVFIRAGYSNDTTCQYFAERTCDYNRPLASEIQGVEGASCVFQCWSGATYDTTGKCLLVWGGGHQGYWGNEVYCFSMLLLKWQRLTTPSYRPNDVRMASLTNANPGIAQTATPHGLVNGEIINLPCCSTLRVTVIDATTFNTNHDMTHVGPLPANSYLCTFEVGTRGQPNSLYMADGVSPNVLHTYAGLQFIRGYGMVVPLLFGGIYHGCYGGRTGIVIFNPATKHWTTAVPPTVDPSAQPILGLGLADIRTAYDPSRNLEYILAGRRGLYAYNPAANTVAIVGAGAVNDGYHMSSTTKPGGPFVTAGIDAMGPSATAGVQIYSTDGTERTTPEPCSANCDALTYTGPNHQGGNGIAYDAVRNKYVMTVPGTRDIYYCDTVTYQWTKRTFTGDTPYPEHSGANGIFGRFTYLPGYDAYFECADFAQVCSVFKP